MLETKRVPADVNPVWQSTFSLNNLEETDHLEFQVYDFGMLEQQHSMGLGPKRLGRCILRVGESGFVGFLDLIPDSAVSSPSCGNPVLHITARFALLQGDLPPVGTIAGVSAHLQSLLGGVGASGSSGSQDLLAPRVADPLPPQIVELKATTAQALQPSALLPSAPVEPDLPLPPKDVPVQVGESGSRGVGESRPHRRSVDSLSEEDESGETEERPQPQVVGESGGVGVSHSSLGKDSYGMANFPLKEGKSSVFYIDEDIFFWQPVNLQMDKIMQLSVQTNKAPFPAQPYRGYNILGAAFDVLADNYADWSKWPGVDHTLFPENLPQVKAAMARLAAAKTHPHCCRGVGVCLRFLEACEVLDKRSQVKNETGSNSH